MKASIRFATVLLLISAAVGFAQDKAGDKSPHKTPLASDAAAGNPVASDEPAQIAAAFFGLLQKDRVEEAYSGLTKGSQIAERPEELQSLKTKTGEAIRMFGAIQGYELVESKSVGTHVLRRTYLSLGKDFPLRWRFYFYRSDNVWRLVDLRVDDRLTGIFDEPEEQRGTDAEVPKP